MIRILLIYISVIAILVSYTPLLQLTNLTFVHIVQVVSLFGLICVSCKQILNHHLRWIFLSYSLIHFITYMFFAEKEGFRIFAMWEIPIVIFLSVKGKDYKKLKPLFFFLLGIFICNFVVALIERINLYSMFPANEEFMEDIKSGMELGDISTFRATALFGHPLTNANAMVIMATCLYFSSIIAYRTKLLCLFLCLISLLLFGARGALFIFVFILFLLFKDNIKQLSIRRNSLLALFTILCIIMIILNADFFASRILNQDMDSEGVMMRIWTIQNFMSIPFQDLLWGGHTLLYQENGYLMTIAESGLVFGGLSILLQIMFSWRILPQELSNLHKIILLLSFIGVGSTNSNLHGYWMINIYIIYVTFIVRYRFSQGRK